MWMAHLGINSQNTCLSKSPVPLLQTLKGFLYCKHSPKGTRQVPPTSLGGASTATSKRVHSLEGPGATEGQRTQAKGHGDWVPSPVLPVCTGAQSSRPAPGGYCV